MKPLNKKLFSLRSRVILTLSLLVIIVSTTLVVFSANMIYQDKRAYLYENSFQSVEYSLKQLESALLSKVRIVEATLPKKDGNFELDQNFWKMDPDLFQIKSFEYNETGMTLNKVILQNEVTEKNTSKKIRPKDVFSKAIDHLYAEAREKGIANSLIYEVKAPPRFVVLVHVPALQAFILYDFLVEKILLSVFANMPYDVTIMNLQGKVFYNNRPYNIAESHVLFYKNFLKGLVAGTPMTGVRELEILKIPYILAYTRSTFFKDYYTLAAIKTSEAYEMTTVFILNTIFWALGLIGFFNVVALFLARSVTKPLDKMNDTIVSISDGEYNARVEPQKIKELEVVGHSFNVMVDKIQEYNEKLKEYNRLLEQKVEERTKELSGANNFIHAMVDSLSQGLLVFNKAGEVHSTFTKACLQLFGRSPKDEPVDLLINYEDKATFSIWVNSLFDEPMPFEEMVAFGPESVPVSADWKDEKFKHIGLEFFPMRVDDKVENVVMVATDKTKEYQAAKENEVQQKYIAMLSKILKDKDTFARFESQFKQHMKESKNQPSLDRMGFMRLVHSLKGMAGFFSLTAVVEYLHQFENDIPLETFDMKLVDGRIDQALALMDTVVKEISEFSPDLLNKVVKIEVDETKLIEFHEMLKPMDADYAFHFKYHFMDWPVEHYIEQYKSLVLDLAAKLNKKVNPLIVINGGLRVDRKAFQPFFDSCIHLFRNSLDHGIEMPEKRRFLNKNETGTIALTFDVKTVAGKKFLYFEMKDDGGGISLTAIRNKMAKLGYTPEEVNEPDDRLVLFRIFDAQFSTAEITTELSGRGIGLFDIKMLIEKYEGNIIVETQVDHGTTFSFYLSYV